MIHCVCDQCGKSAPEDLAAEWFVVTHPHPNPIVVHLCSILCLKKWAPREELRLKHLMAGV